MKTKWPWWFPVLCLFILAVWACTPWGLRSAVGDKGDPGALASQFEAITALFSGLAFAGVIAAIVLQSQELALQREELKLTREEMKKSVEAQQASSRALEETMSQERQLTRKRLTVELYAEWHHGDLLVARNGYGEWVRRNPNYFLNSGKPDLMRVSTMDGEISLLVDVLDYLERCALLKRVEEIDGNLFLYLMGRQLRDAASLVDATVGLRGGTAEYDQLLLLVHQELFEPAAAALGTS